MENGKASGLPKAVHAWFFISFSSQRNMTAQRMKGSRTCAGTAGQKGWSINVGDCSSA